MKYAWTLAICLAVLCLAAPSEAAPQKALRDAHVDLACADCHTGQKNPKQAGAVSCAKCHDAPEVAKRTASRGKKNPHISPQEVYKRQVMPTRRACSREARRPSPTTGIKMCIRDSVDAFRAGVCGVCAGYARGFPSSVLGSFGAGFRPQAAVRSLGTCLLYTS